MSISPRAASVGTLAFFVLLGLGACSTASDSASTAAGDGGGGGVSASSGASSSGAGSSGSGSSGTSGTGSSSGAVLTDGGTAPFDDAGASDPDAQAPPAFWDDTGIPPAKNVMTFKFLNRTNGKYTDAEVFWRFQTGAINELHSIAEQATYDMPANSSGRMYFFLCAAGDATCAADPTKSKYYDFIEHTIGPHQYNGNTTRVDAFGLKIAMRMHCADGFDTAVGEDYATFLEDRAVTFQKFIDGAPAEWKALAQAPNAPYRIVEPGAGGFNAGGAHATYYDAFVDAIWANSKISVPKPGSNGSNLGAYPDLSAAIYRHMGDAAGTFDANGKLLNQSLWKDSSKFYSAAPADYYAQFWHLHALGGKAYGFPYDDVGGYSSYISHDNPQTMMVAIGF